MKRRRTMDFTGSGSRGCLWMGRWVGGASGCFDGGGGFGAGEFSNETQGCRRGAGWGAAEFWRL